MNDLENQLRQSLQRSHHLAPTTAVVTRGTPVAVAPMSVGEHLLYRDLSHAIVGAAIEVHRHLGPGQLESTYQRSLEYELELRELPFRAQVPVAATYKGRETGEFFVDLIVDDKVVIELKAVTALMQVHRAQVISYLRATRLRLGLLINFHVPVLYKGVTRVIL